MDETPIKSGNDITDEESIIYLALSNLQLSCIELLEQVKDNPSAEQLEQYEMSKYLLEASSKILEKMNTKYSGTSPIQRPQW